MKKLLPLMLAFALTACGGGSGGGGGGGGNNAGGAGATGLSVNFSTSSLNFEFYEGELPKAQIVNASASGTTDKDVLMGAEVTGGGIATPISVVVNNATRSAVITVKPQPGLAAGTYSGTIKMMACADQACATHHGGSPYSVTYKVTVRPGLKASVAQTSLAAVETGSASGSFTFTSQSAGTTVNSSISYDNSVAGWLTAQISGNTVQLQASTATLAAGAYTAKVNLSVPGTSLSVTVPVTFTVAAGLSTPDGAGLKIDSGTMPAQLAGTIPLAIAAGATAKTWTAVSDQPWLKIAQASAGFNTLPAWSIDPVLFAQLANNAHHKANIRITTDSTLPARTYTLDVHKALAELEGLDSLALLAGQSGEVMLYGSGFDRLPAGAAALTVTGVQPQSVTRVNDHVMRVALPALSAGSYQVALTTASGLSTPAKAIHVTGKETYTYQAFDTQGWKNAMVWDSVSKSAFVLNATLKSVMRYAAVNGSFQLVATRSFPAVDSLGMTPDHSALILQSNGNTVYKLSPADLSTQKTITIAQYGSPQYLTTPLAITGDNRMLHPMYGWVNLDTGAVTQLAYAPSNQYHAGGPADFGAVSGNGMRMMRPDSGRTSPSGASYHFDLLSNVFTAYPQEGVPYFHRFAVDHNGNNWAFNGEVVDFELNLKGKYELPDGWLSTQAVFSRNGTRLYLYGQYVAGGGKPRIFVFDTSQKMTTTVQFPLLGHIEFDDLPNCPYSSFGGFDPNCNTFQTQIAISADDQTVFVAGDRKFAVIPIPASLRSTGNRQGMRSLQRMVISK